MSRGRWGKNKGHPSQRPASHHIRAPIRSGHPSERGIPVDPTAEKHRSIMGGGIKAIHHSGRQPSHQGCHQSDSGHGTTRRQGLGAASRPSHQVISQSDSGHGTTGQQGLGAAMYIRGRAQACAFPTGITLITHHSPGPGIGWGAGARPCRSGWRPA